MSCEEVSGKIFEALDDKEVREITREMIAIEHVDGAVAREILEEYNKVRGGDIGVYVRGGEFAKHAILGTGDPTRAQNLLEQVHAGIESRPLETISKMHPRMVAGLLKMNIPRRWRLFCRPRKKI